MAQGGEKEVENKMVKQIKEGDDAMVQDMKEEEEIEGAACPRLIEEKDKLCMSDDDIDSLTSEQIDNIKFDFDLESFTPEELDRLAEFYVKDDNEEYVSMTVEEANEFFSERFRHHSKDPEINPGIRLTEQQKELLAQMKEKKDGLHGPQNGMHLMYDNQIKFLRRIGILPKIETRSIGVLTDFPYPPDDSCPSETMCDVNDSIDSSAKVITPSFESKNSKSASKRSKRSNKRRKSKRVPKANQAPQTIMPKPVPETKQVPQTVVEAKCNDLTEDLLTESPSSSTFGDALKTINPPASLLPKQITRPNKRHPNLPPKPSLVATSEENGIVLQWDMPDNIPANSYGRLESFDIFGYEEQADLVISNLVWNKIGSVKALNLPMACTLSKFDEGRRYYFSIRAVDIFERYGSRSDTVSVVYKKTQH